MHRRFLLVPSALAFALASALPSSTSAQQAAHARLSIDAATHATPGMKGLGMLGRLSGAMSGNGGSYGQTRHPGMPGKYLDVALRNSRKPGAPATQAVPRDLRLGDSIELLAPEQAQPAGGASVSDGALGGHGDGTFRIRYYWGCGEQVRAGQPAEYTVTVRNGKPTTRGRAMAPRKVPQAGISPNADTALWPNPGARKAVSAKASLVGQHHLTGDGLPDAMRFDLGREHDFLPELELERSGDAEQGSTLGWNGVEGARAYFIHATAAGGDDTIVMWSSSADAYAGQELFDYLPESLVAQWTKQRTLLGADARECRIPKGVFAADAAPMVQMIAYGNDRTITRDGWSVRVRSKSTAMLMPGGAMSPKDAARPAAKDAAKGFLRGLIGR